MTNEEEEILEHLIDSGFGSYKDNGRLTCPLCGPHRRKQNERTLSVSMDGDVALYMCHHCDEKGSVILTDTKLDFRSEPSVTDSHKPEGILNQPPPKYSPLEDDQLDWLSNMRRISNEVADKAGLVTGEEYIRSRKGHYKCIGFQYKNRDGTHAVKWRDGAGNWTQTGSARSLWKIEEYESGDLIITEGELDALSFAEAGIFATSVPNGAPNAPVKDGTKDSKKFAYLWDAKETLAKADRVIIAGDQDGAAGDILVEELARRIGKAKCWRMSYPDDCKDANDVLVKYGPVKLKDLLAEVTPWPIGGLREAKDYKDEAIGIWRDGMSRGVDLPTGKIADYYRPSPGTLTIVTGVPGSGKSTWLNWLTYQLAKTEGWSTAVFAAETSSQVHLLQLASLHTGKPFRGHDKMSQTELESAITWLTDKFVFLDESETSIDSIIERAQAAVLRNGVRGLMIDPFNFITMERPKEGDNGQHGINQLLVKLKVFAVEHDVAVWLVAHPTKMYRDGKGNTPIPTGYDISGSAHFFNVADSGLTVSRSVDQVNITRLTSWKARFMWLGSIGDTEIAFNPHDCSYFTKTEWGDTASDWDLD